MSDKPEITLYCSFCGQSQHEVPQLIAGLNYAFICNECVDLAAEIVQKYRAKHGKPNTTDNPSDTSKSGKINPFISDPNTKS